MLEFDQPIKNRRWLDLAPMIDVIFLLLIFFMLTSIYAKPVIPVELPQAGSSQEQEKTSIDIVIDSSGSMAINGKSTSEEMFAKTLLGMTNNPETAFITLYADQNISFGRFLSIMDKTRLCGINNVSIATIRPGEHAQ